MVGSSVTHSALSLGSMIQRRTHCAPSTRTAINSLRMRQMSTGIPDDEAILVAVRSLKLEGSSAKKITATLKTRYPNWAGGSKEVRTLLHRIVLEESQNAPKLIDEGKSNNVNDPFVITEIDGKGLGVVAARSISAGELILAESPLVRALPGSAAEAAVQALPEADQAFFYSLQQHSERFGATKTVQGVWRTNALPLEGEDGVQAIFRMACRFNHACSALAHHAWDPSKATLHVHAVQQIAEGTEITICYCKEGTRQERQEFLKGAFGFTCKCATCGLTGDALKESDARQRRIQQLDQEISVAAQVLSDPEELLELARERIALMKEEGMGEALWAEQALAQAVGFA